MSQIFTWIWVSSGILLILLVLLHSPKGDGMGGIAASGSSMFTSASSAEASLNKITWTILIIFLALAIILSAGWIQKNQIQLYLKIKILNKKRDCFNNPFKTKIYCYLIVEVPSHPWSSSRCCIFFLWQICNDTFCGKYHSCYGCCIL